MAGTSNTLPRSCPYKLNGFRFNRGNALENCREDDAFLLDLYTGSLAAYSLRALSSSTTNVIRVRRSSDNSEQDFNAGEVTDGTLTTFTGANDGFVVTWYDQSGNSNNATQATALDQPKIVSSGTVTTDNGKPSIRWDGSQDLFATAFSNSSAVSGSFSVSSMDTLATYYIHDVATNRFGARYNNPTMAMVDESPANKNASTAVAATQEIHTFHFENNAAYIRKNSSQSSTINPFSQTTTTKSGLHIGSFRNSGAWLVGYMSELVIYNSDKSADYAAIEDNINTFYSTF